jgi:hypothetical protein
MATKKLQKMFTILLPSDAGEPILIFDYRNPEMPRQTSATLAQVKTAVFQAILQGHTVVLDDVSSNILGSVINIVSADEIARVNANYKIVPIEDYHG